jgi:hypothetical protein
MDNLGVFDTETMFSLTVAGVSVGAQAFQGCLKRVNRKPISKIPYSMDIYLISCVDGPVMRHT